MSARIVRIRQGKHSRYIFGLRSSNFTAEAGSGLSTVSPTRYAIEIRDKDYNLKDRLENAVTSLQWEWNRIGGCGRCSIVVEGNYLRLSVAADDDVRIYLTDASGTSATLWYRGYVEAVTPQLTAGNDGNIRIDCAGYFNWLDRIVVHDSGAVKTYTSQEISLIVQDLIDNFVVTNAPITRGTVDASTFVPDTLEFKVTVKEALRTLFDLLGAVEYGVDTSLQFYWRTQSETVAHKFYLGGNVVKLADRVDFKNIMNKIHFEGGDVSGTTFVPTPATAQDSIDRYGLHEEIISNGSIVTNSVANQFMSAVLLQRSKPSRQMSISLKNINRRFETTQPLGAIAVVDPDVAQSRYLWGTTANGGANRLWGLISNSGSGTIYGAVRKEQIDRIMYTMSPEDGRVDAEVQFGTSIGNSKASATIKRLEIVQSTLRQRSL